MSIVHEEINHPHIDAEIMVCERARGETVEDWYIASVRVDGMDRMTPEDLCDLGRWLVSNGERIKREYTKAGKPKATKEPKP